MVHFWPFWSSNQNLLNYINNQAFTFVFYRSDWEVVQDVFSWGYHVGMVISSFFFLHFKANTKSRIMCIKLFKESKVGTTNGQFSNIDFDNVDVGLALYSSQDYGLMFSNLNIANAVRALSPSPFSPPTFLLRIKLFFYSIREVVPQERLLFASQGNRRTWLSEEEASGAHSPRS